MKRIKLFKFFALFILSAFAGKTNAQYASEILGARLIVETPSSISGVKAFTYSSNPEMTGPWGGALGIVSHAEVVKAVDTEACSTVTGVSGKWALIYRGNCEFGSKALHAQQAGAQGVIIWNHTPNELVNMGAGSDGASVTIPVLFISNADGRDMTNQLSNGQQVFISITPWGFGNNHDIALVNGSPAPGPGMAIPITQLDGTDVPEYRGYTAALIANTGTSTETNVTVKSSVTFTPQAGSPTVVQEDSTVINSFDPTDSLLVVAASDDFQFNPPGIGRYDFNYTVYADDPDDFMFDNNGKFSMEVTPNVFSRGRFDVAKQEPKITGYTRSSGTNPFTWGPMFYLKNGKYKLDKLSFALYDNDTSKHTLFQGAGGSFIQAFVFKWEDANSDEYINGNELTLVGSAVHEFTTADSAKKIMTADIGNPTDGTPQTIVSQDNTHYWIAFDLGTVFFLSVDANSNYYTREYAAVRNASPSHDFWAPAISAAAIDITAATDTVRSIPFGITVANSNIIDSADYLSQDAVPAVALFIGTTQLAVPNVPASASWFNLYPNPAKETVTAELDFDKPIAKAYINIVDAIGRRVYISEYMNVQKDKIIIPVNNLSPGNYYLSVIAEGKASIKQFTVAGK